MSLAIEVSDVTAVLMKEGRHTVTEKSFEIDKFDFCTPGRRPIVQRFRRACFKYGSAMERTQRDMGRVPISKRVSSPNE